jgi:DNA-binding NarL/FixJ family response regulator
MKSKNQISGGGGVTLTKRQKEILLLTGKEGLCSKEVAHRLCISEKTVNTHKHNMLFNNQSNNLCHLLYTYLVSISLKNT